jgi:cytochrome c oxidase subunit 4
MGGHDGHGELGHILPHSVYRNVLVALLVLTVITVLVSAKANFVEFGAWSLVIAMLIASVKAGIVALYFMHLKYENPVTWLYVIFPIILLATLIGGVFIDNPTRIDPREGTFMAEQMKDTPAKKKAGHGHAHH